MHDTLQHQCLTATNMHPPKECCHAAAACCLYCFCLSCSLEKQVAFSTALLLDWCGATPVGTSEQVLKQLLGA